MKNYKDTELRLLVMEHRKAHGYPVPSEQYEGGSNSDKSEHENTQEQLIQKEHVQVHKNLFLGDEPDPKKVEIADRPSPFFEKPEA